jgi:hypothetical protein
VSLSDGYMEDYSALPTVGDVFIAFQSFNKLRICVHFMVCVCYSINGMRISCSSSALLSNYKVSVPLLQLF